MSPAPPFPEDPAAAMGAALNGCWAAVARFQQRIGGLQDVL
ncbi:MAG TPA: hypothetical protein VMU89_03535 [Thermomicrobiaceae bacterium]|nr:hypothetical protein [Thermomicrobiaceae bacterium]